MLAAGCGPVYSTSYEFVHPQNPDRACFAQCLSAKSQCARLERIAQLQEEEIYYERCMDEADEEENAKKRKRKREKCAHTSPSFGGGSSAAGCEAEYRDCFRACGGRVIEVTECVYNCDQE